MLQKLTSPKAKGARGTSGAKAASATIANAERSALTAASSDASAASKRDDQSSSRDKRGKADSAEGSSDGAEHAASSRTTHGGRAAATTTDRATPKPMTKLRDDLRLDMRAVAEAVARDAEDTANEETAADNDEPSLSKREGSLKHPKPLIRSPRIRKDLVASVEDETTKEEKAGPSARKTLVRSPRVRKDIMGMTEDTKASSDADTSVRKLDTSDDTDTPPSKKAPSKRPSFAGLRALKPRSAAKPTAATPNEDKPSSASNKRDADDDDNDASDGAISRDRGRTTTKSSKGKRATAQGSSKANNSDANRKTTLQADRLDERDEVHSEQRDEVHSEQRDSRIESEVTPQQSTKSVLSPLRRRTPMHQTAPVGTSTTTLLDMKPGHRLQLRDLPPASQPEVHIVGEITTGEGFGSGSNGYACKWGVEIGGAWHHIAGDQVGQTQIDYPSTACVVWSHPLELHFATTSFHGWPKLLLQVWRFDAHMVASVVGYGFVNVPFAAGEHCVTATLWRPMGTATQELAATLLGRTPELVTDDVVFRAAWANRCRLQTVATGTVQLQLGVVLRNFDTSSLAM